MREKAKSSIINIIISIAVIFATLGFAELSGSELVVKTAWYVLVIHWLAFIPALIFKTEKFYDLTGSICYAFSAIYAVSYTHLRAHET